MDVYKTGRTYDLGAYSSRPTNICEQVLEIIRVEGGYNFRILWSGISGHIVANYDCTSGAILGSAILGHYDRGEYALISEADFENSKDLDVYSIDFAS